MERTNKASRKILLFVVLCEMENCATENEINREGWEYGSMSLSMHLHIAGQTENSEEDFK